MTTLERGRISGVAAGALFSIVLLVACVWLLADDDAQERVDRLMLFCAAGIKPPVAAVVAEYERRTGVHVDVQYGGSGTLLTQIAVARTGDLYLAGDASFVERARERGFIAERFAIATMRPVIGVAKGNPLGIRDLDDLRRDDIRLGLAHADATAVGRATRQVLSATGHWSSVKPHAAVFKSTVNELANDLVIGAIDAAVIWDSTANQYDEIDFVAVTELEAETQDVTLGVLNSSPDATSALHFARFLTARDAGLLEFTKAGYTVVDGDAWVDRPEIVLMSGAMLRAAIEDTVAEFAAREGVEIARVYNGCGILVAQMRGGREADAYFSCDESFLADVQDRFEPGQTFSQNDIVMLVAKGNPGSIQSLTDLGRDGLRIGVGHPENSALGALTHRLLAEAGVLAELRERGNIVVETPTGDLLVSQSRAGSLDVSLVYRSNAAEVRDALDIVPIDHELAHATQPFAIQKDNEHRHLLGRLRERLLDASSRASFEQLGFVWRAEGGSGR